MTNAQCPMTNECRSGNDEGGSTALGSRGDVERIMDSDDWSDHDRQCCGEDFAEDRRCWEAMEAEEEMMRERAESCDGAAI